MLIERIPADDIRLNDIIGEGQVVWGIVKDKTKEEIDFWWGEPGSSMIRPDWHKTTFRRDDLVNVIRSKPDEIPPCTDEDCEYSGIPKHVHP